MNAPRDLSHLNVLITGGLGFIGSNLAHRCVELGARVTIYDSLDPRCGGNTANVAGIDRDVQVVIGDIRDRDRLTPVARESDVVFHCAAYTSHAGSMKDPLTDIDVNCKGTINLLEAVRAADRRVRVVHLGTSTQIGRMIHRPVTEDHPEFPTVLYAADKTAAEKYVLIYGRSYGIPVTVIRLANVYGPRAKIVDPGLGFINYFVGMALQGKDLTVYGDGDQLRSATFVDDVVEALLLAATSDAALGDVLFATSETLYTVRQLANEIVTAIGRGRVRSVEWPGDRAAIEVGDVVISSARIERLLGWRAVTDLRDGIGRTARYFGSRLKAYVG